MPSNKNTCHCPNPPGGVVVCEPHQLAICRVKDGVVHAECITPPADMPLIQAFFDRIANWALAQITGARRLPFQLLTDSDRHVLEDGIYENAVTGEAVRFRLPFIGLGPNNA
jgi:hypothetical protein